jgi:sulfate adenylyltransferase subunit 2
VSDAIVELEAEAIYVLREVAAKFERPVVLFSGGKDSAVHLRERAAGRPSEPPVQSGHGY